MTCSNSLPVAATTALGSLPHLDADEAIAFSFERLRIPVLPLLPKRSATETPIVQALLGVQGVSFGQYGSVGIDVARLDPDAPVLTPLDDFALGGFRAGLDGLRSGRQTDWVKWQFAGPISVGIALIRGGAPADVAFRVSARAVAAHLTAIGGAIELAAPRSRQLIVINEPFARDIPDQYFPLAPAVAVDLLSASMATAQAHGLVGVRGGDGADLALLIESGPTVLGVSLDDAAASSSYLARFVDGGGTIAWGIPRTEGPVPETVTPDLRRVVDALAPLLAQGIDVDLIRERSLVTPDGDLAAHSVAAAGQIVTLLDSIASIVASPGETRRLLRSQR